MRSTIGAAVKFRPNSVLVLTVTPGLYHHELALQHLDHLL